jgi:hypothetical protein
MKQIILLVFVLAVLAPAFSQEEGPKGALEIEAGLEAYFITGLYDSDGEFHEATGSPAVYVIPISVMYEFLTGLEAGIKIRYDIQNEDAGDDSGLEQPAIEVKYTSEFGLGAFIDTYLPFGTEEIVGTDPEFYFDIAVFYDNNFDAFLLYVELMYTLTFEGEDDASADVLTITVQPGYTVMENLNVNLGIELIYDLGLTISGTAIDDSSAYVVSIIPGVEYKVMDMLKLTLDAPITLFGASSEANVLGIPLNIALASWGIRFKATLNLL